ncbi:cAMP-responsive element modulator-like isoform X1 [Astyanax mexicanus]|uniref:cAMP-responsive element modulator-like isoform X1 n=1 Tax=Astyanax mexicanus TaxID=7994 RepID=A0A8T2M4D2_ASTMX|nr:cAMP-responsive element modulator-like isoform X1 [Astyanax mexicanus]
MNSNGGSGHFPKQRMMAGNQDSAFRQVTPRNEIYARGQNEPSSDNFMIKIAEVVDSPIPVPVSNYYSANASRLFGFNSESSFQSYQTFNMSPSAPQHPTTAIFQCTAQDIERVQQYYVPAQAPASNMSAYQIHSPSSSLPQGVVMTSPPSSLHSPQHVAEETSHKRELRLLKNRLAAKASRRKRREYVHDLESRIAELQLQNMNLTNEINHLKKSHAVNPVRAGAVLHLI